jgi:hypothetical protein
MKPPPAGLVSEFIQEGLKRFTSKQGLGAVSLLIADRVARIGLV